MRAPEQAPAQEEVRSRGAKIISLVCGVKRKNGNEDEPRTKKPKKNPLPKNGDRPVIKMTLDWELGKKGNVRALLDTGSTVPLLSLSRAREWGVPMLARNEPVAIRGFDNTIVTEAGIYFTVPITINQGNHYTAEVFECTPLDANVDIILPWWWMAKHKPNELFGKIEDIRFESEFCKKHCTHKKAKEFDIDWDEEVLDHPEAMIVGFIAGKEEPQEEEKKSGLSLIPERFWEYAHRVAEGKLADQLPSHKPYDHTIDLKEGETLPYGPIYPLNQNELSILKEWIEVMLRQGKIRRSKSPAAAPILFVPKKHGRGIRICVDYRGLNKVTIANRYPIPLMNELQDRVRGAKIFTKLDLKNGYHLIRIKEGDEWKTAFRTRYGLYEFLVMPFGLSNAPATFQAMMNNIFADMLDNGTIAFLDDCLIYTATMEEHDAIVKEVLRRLDKHDLAINPEKCEWAVERVEFLGYIVSAEGLEMAEDKVRTVQEWASPRSLRDVQQFLGFANFYRRFIEGFSKVAKPLTESTKGKRLEWNWTNQCEQAFQELKKRFTTAPILAHFDPNVEAIVETDASDFALGGVLSQRKQETGKLHPIAFHSRKFSPAEINYEIHDKELLAVVDCFKVWRRYLEGAMNTVQVFSDHQNLEYFSTTKVLNRRQARWAMELAGIDFKIYYRPGSKNGKPDALSRRPEYRPQKGGDENQPITTVLHKEHFAQEEYRSSAISTGGAGTVFLVSSARLSSIPAREWSKEFRGMVKKASEKDEEYQKALARVKTGKETRLLRQDGEILLRKEKLWVPSDKQLRDRILNSEHDAKAAGHYG